jgi:hypothetical protein
VVIERKLMNVRHQLSSCVALSLALVAGGCSNAEFTHVKPGQSARMAVLIKTAPIGKPRELIAKPGIPVRKSPAYYAAIEALAVDMPAPGLADVNAPAPQAAEAFARSSSAMHAGQTGEAILALEEAVHIDPSFSDAWNQLANLYHHAGQEGKANDAARKVKDLAQNKGPDALIPGNIPELNP